MILVAGATGSLGSRIVLELVRAGESVRALVRPTSDRRLLDDAGIEVVVGDLRDAVSLIPACGGVSAVISTASTTRRGDDSPENVDGRGTCNLIDAARAAGVRRFVLVSTQGADPASPVPAFRAKGLAEKHLMDSGLDWTVLRPDAFMDVWFGMLIEMPVAAGQPVTLIDASRRRHAFVAERDVAAFAIAAVHSPAAKNALVDIGGPEAITFRDAVAAYEQALGRPIPLRSIAADELIPGIPPEVSAIAAQLDRYDSPIPMEDTAHRFGVSLTDVGTLARDSRLARLPA